jgi:hypothetical protein
MLRPLTVFLIDESAFKTEENSNNITKKRLVKFSSDK